MTINLCKTSDVSVRIYSKLRSLQTYSIAEHFYGPLGCFLFEEIWRNRDFKRSSVFGFLIMGENWKQDST